MSVSGLSVGSSVVRDMARLAAVEVPGVLRVGRGGPPWRGWGRRSVVAKRRGEVVTVRIWVVARPGRALGAVTAEVRAAVTTTIERLLGLEVGSVTVVVDGIGG
jgi:uncharacterized alkaline shock family protein YloU